MAATLAGALWACLIAWLAWRAARQFAAHRSTSLAQLAQPTPAGPLPDVAIIVPARNEIANIADCVAALIAQRGLSAASSITIVDDGSQDGTGAAAAHAGRDDRRVAVIESGPLPTGWVGKPHACWQGALAARAEWLCFVDADVRAAPDLLRLAVSVAERHGIDMLSLHPFQQLGGFSERLIIPAGLVLIGCANDLRPVNDPESAAVSANGQFILIRRAVYFALGGHAAVRAQVSEDKALAALAKGAGARFRMLAAEDLARTRMYTSFAALWEGLSKNATEIIGDAAATVAAASAALVVGWASLLLPLLTGLAAARLPSTAALAGFALALSASLAVVGIHIATARHFRIPAIFGLLFPVAYTAIAALAWRSAALRRGGRVTWKGRTYEIDRQA
ncbi:MAG TPA: glycosyltransferase family A protein [Stellaceae bacterium]|nr:glycosyltransferase family A protein [Stellaceae bacterium]